MRPPAAAVLAAIFTIYPGPNAEQDGIEAITDRGPIAELIVRCPQGAAIITYSKLERRYCDPQLRCDDSREVVVSRACAR